MKAYTSQRTKKIEYIVVHHTGCVAPAKNFIMALENYAKAGKTVGSADYFVDDNSVEQYNDNIRFCYTWHSGIKFANGLYNYDNGTTSAVQPICTNDNSIGVEMCNISGAPDWKVSDATINRAIKLIKLLQDTYGIPDKNVIFHYDVTKKNCPFPATRTRFMELFKNS